MQWNNFPAQSGQPDSSMLRHYTYCFAVKTQETENLHHPLHSNFFT
jgi:hypothetical protein